MNTAEEGPLGEVEQASRQIRDGDIGIHRQPSATRRKNRLDLRCEVGLLAILIEVERLDAKAVAGHKQGFLLYIVQEERPHAIERGKSLRTGLDERSEDHGGIAEALRQLTAVDLRRELPV